MQHVRDKRRMCGRQSGDDLAGSIVRTVVPDQNFDLAVGRLRQETFEACADVAALVEGGHAYRNAGHGHGPVAGGGTEGLPLDFRVRTSSRISVNAVFCETAAVAR